MVAWPDLPWKKIQRHVFRLQKRIYRATQHGQVRIARKLQQLLVKSWYARLLAVRRTLNFYLIVAAQSDPNT